MGLCSLKLFHHYTVLFPVLASNKKEEIIQNKYANKSTEIVKNDCKISSVAKNIFIIFFSIFPP